MNCGRPTRRVQLRGEERYEHLVRLCRNLGVLTPEDPYPLWDGAGGPVTIAPLFLLYDYSFQQPGASDKEEGLASRRGWCARMNGCCTPTLIPAGKTGAATGSN